VKAHAKLLNNVSILLVEKDLLINTFGILLIEENHIELFHIQNSIYSL